MNKKGFVFIETVIVLLVLVFGILSLYGTYIVLSSNLNRRKHHDNISDLYKVAILKEEINDELSSDFSDYVEINKDNTSINFCTQNMLNDDCLELMNDLNVKRIIINLIPINNLLEYSEGLENSFIEYLKTLRTEEINGEYSYKKYIIVQFDYGVDNTNNYYYASLEM